MAKSPYIKKGSLYQIGDVMHSILGEADFNTLHGGGWVLMDGQDVTGTGYHALTGQTTVPDSRGLFLRGKDNGRLGEDGLGHPTSDLAIGTREGDAFDSHNHGGGSHSHSVINLTQALGGSGNVNFIRPLNASGSASSNLPTGGPSTTVVSSQGGSETRPRNMTVNIYVKVD